jgi:hypothetical protein
VKREAAAPTHTAASVPSLLFHPFAAAAPPSPFPHVSTHKLTASSPPRYTEKEAGFVKAVQDDLGCLKQEDFERIKSSVPHVQMFMMSESSSLTVRGLVVVDTTVELAAGSLIDFTSRRASQHHYDHGGNYRDRVRSQP